MVRTKSDVGGARVSAAKAPRKIASAICASASPSGKAGASKDRFGGGNSYNPQPTPKWQKGIGSFFNKEKSSVDQEAEESSVSSPSAVAGSSKE